MSQAFLCRTHCLENFVVLAHSKIAHFSVSVIPEPCKLSSNKSVHASQHWARTIFSWLPFLKVVRTNQSSIKLSPVKKMADLWHSPKIGKIHGVTRNTKKKGKKEKTGTAGARPIALYHALAMVPATCSTSCRFYLILDELISCSKLYPNPIIWRILTGIQSSKNTPQSIVLGNLMNVACLY